ncbi:hypothetical protein [uncultured Thiohalocapsa sp.]|uniref:hypothetical protein n=1 Tax=uncultured Thiohalocapsa sp. TaxID=768990 RepID=UPI0025D626A6|nr:hypothetical protein [uncultured Thiohalocapsa sp.]
MAIGALDQYFRQRITQDIRRRVTACFVAVTPEKDIAGDYTLASASPVLAEPQLRPRCIG